MPLTQERLKAVLRYDEITGYFFWISLPPHMQERVGARAGTVYPNGYRYIQIDGQPYREHRLAWLYVHGAFPGHQLDHRNRKKDDNRIANLRECNDHFNQGNRAPMLTNKSGITGVRWEAERKRWRAAITVNGKTINLGRFRTSDEAIAARRAAEVRHYGAFANHHEEN